MGKRREKIDSSIRSSQTLPSSPSHSSSSSDFEFTISVSPRRSTAAICPADELFYKGQLLPLHLTPRISMVRTLLLASSSTSSSSTDTTTTASRDSTGSTSSTSSFASDLVLLAGDCDSSRPSSVTEDDESFFKRSFNPSKKNNSTTTTTAKYFSLSRFSSVFKKDPCKIQNDQSGPSSVKRMSATAKEVIRKYFKKVKPLYEKLSQKQKMDVVSSEHHPTMSTDFSADHQRSDGKDHGSNNISFSGNLRYPRRRSCVSSCPSSMRSSPSHSGVLSKNGYAGPGPSNRVGGGGMFYGDASSMEELQNAIQGAIAHCKNSMVQTGSSSKAVMCNEI